MTSAQEIETSAIATDNSSLKESFCPDDQRSRLAITPGFKPFTVLTLELISFIKLKTRRTITLRILTQHQGSVSSLRPSLQAFCFA